MTSFRARFSNHRSVQLVALERMARWSLGRVLASRHATLRLDPAASGSEPRDLVDTNLHLSQSGHSTIVPRTRGPQLHFHAETRTLGAYTFFPTPRTQISETPDRGLKMSASAAQSGDI